MTELNVYTERAILVAHLAAIYPSHIGYTDPDEPDWPVVIIETPTGQMSWHIAPDDVHLFEHVMETDRMCRGWDGHSTTEKYRRLAELTQYHVECGTRTMLLRRDCDRQT